jgi:hypothetical protein
LCHFHLAPFLTRWLNTSQCDGACKLELSCIASDAVTLLLPPVQGAAEALQGDSVADAHEQICAFHVRPPTHPMLHSASSLHLHSLLTFSHPVALLFVFVLFFMQRFTPRIRLVIQTSQKASPRIKHHSDSRLCPHTAGEL